MKGRHISQTLPTTFLNQKSACKDFMGHLQKEVRIHNVPSPHLAYLHPTLFTIKYNLIIFPPSPTDMVIPAFKMPV